MELGFEGWAMQLPMVSSILGNKLKTDDFKE